MHKQDPVPSHQNHVRGPIISILAKIFGKLAILFTAVMFIGLLGLGTTLLHIRAGVEKPPQAHPALTVNTTRIIQQDSYIEQSYYVGRLEPARQTALGFERSGLITIVSRDESDSVRKGEILAELDTAQLEARRNQLVASQRELEARKKFALSTKQRRTKLNQKGWATGERLDQAQADVDQLTAAIDRIKAQINGIDIDIRKSKLVAPFDGIISSRSIDEGAVVAAGTPVLTLLEASHRQARIGLPPEQANKLDHNQSYILRARKHRLTGKIVAYRPDLQPGTRTVTVLFDVSGAEAIRFGELVTLELETKVPLKGAWLPLTALKEGKKGLWTILTVVGEGKDKIIRSEAVEILHANDQSAYVRGTYMPDAMVLTNGINRVTEGQRVALVKE